MPEISIIKPLCEELSITINELFCGEKIVETEFSEKAEENIVNTLEYTKTEIKKTKKIFSAVFVGVVGIIIILITQHMITLFRIRLFRARYFKINQHQFLYLYKNKFLTC